MCCKLPLEYIFLESLHFAMYPPIFLFVNLIVNMLGSVTYLTYFYDLANYSKANYSQKLPIDNIQQFQTSHKN